MCFKHFFFGSLFFFNLSFQSIINFKRNHGFNSREIYYCKKNWEQRNLSAFFVNKSLTWLLPKYLCTHNSKLMTLSITNFLHSSVCGMQTHLAHTRLCSPAIHEWTHTSLVTRNCCLSSLYAWLIWWELAMQRSTLLHIFTVYTHPFRIEMTSIYF